MKLEQKKLSSTQTVFYLPKTLPFIGTFYQDEHVILQNILATNLAAELLLTADFLYLKSTTPTQLADLEILSIAQLDDYLASPPLETIAPATHLTDKIKLILQIVIAPMLQKDGGNIELQKYENNIAYVHFLGKCHGCPYAERTLKNHVEKNLIHYLPQIKEAILI